LGLADVDQISTGSVGQQPVSAMRAFGFRTWVGTFVGVMGLLVAGPADAHQPDTSYARFKVTRDSFTAKFSYDLSTLQRIVPKLDANGDYQVTAAELQAQVPAVFAFLQKHVRLEINGAATDFGEPQPVAFPPATNGSGSDSGNSDSGNRGSIAEPDYHSAGSLVHFTFLKRLARPPADFWVQFELFEALGERHTVLGVIEHEGEEHEVLFRQTQPDYLYDTGYQPSPAEMAENNAATENSAAAASPRPLDSRSADARSPATRSNEHASPWQQMSSFFELGVEHIFLGFDHILFLLSLLIVSRFRELIKIVTSFTVAHSITLILATLDAVQLPSRLVESAIAATIVYVAVENFWVKSTAHRWKLTFFCGLIHGFGFAGVLRELGLPTQGLVRSLLSFNVGVEAGQLLIVAALLPLVTFLARWRYGQQAQRAISAAIALCGACWFVDRAFGLGIMPF
jgi:hypothetical protein